MAIAFIGIGSNMGERLFNCKEAVRKVNLLPFASVIRVSKFRETKPILDDEEPQTDYINGVMKIETTLSPSELLLELHKIEKEMGRIRTGRKWELTVIDLDILFYDDLVINEQDLKVPHPELHKRMFVLEPLCDIAQDLMHQVLKKDIKHLREEILNSNI